MATTRIDVKPAVLHWVQEASNGTLNEAWTNKIDKWLKNESKPTLNIYKKVAKRQMQGQALHLTFRRLHYLLLG